MYRPETCSKDSPGDISFSAFSYLFQMNIAIDVAFSNLANNRQLGIFSLEGVDDPNEPAHAHNDIDHHQGKDSKILDQEQIHIDKLNQKNHHDSIATKEKQGLHGMKANQALLIAKNQKQQPC
jgi:hypothetical protein